MQDEVKLRPCPFCGGKADWNEQEGEKAWFYVECLNVFEDKCSVMRIGQTARHPTKTAAIQAWNRRADLEAKIKEVEGLLSQDDGSEYDAGRVDAIEECLVILRGA